MMKRIACLLAAMAIGASAMCFSASAAIMYSADGRVISVVDGDVEKYESDGWYSYPVMTVYSEDGRSLVIPMTEYKAYESVGWSKDCAKTVLYAADGRTIEVNEHEVSAYLAVGWYTEAMTTVYALDGRELVIPVAQVELYESVGWYVKPVATGNSADSAVLDSEQIYAYCSPAVFYIEIYNRAGYAIASGSGFFIDANGTAVTNFHVIEGAATAKIQIAGTGEVYNVEGVYDYDKSVDWAVIKVKCSGNKYLKFGNSSTVVGGAQVYAIGSPEGLQNTISQGIISNAARENKGVTYIQTTAPISSGSSGGALINKYGDVIGITTSQYVEGQNLNFAVPVSYVAGYETTKVTTLLELNGYVAPSSGSISGNGNGGYYYGGFDQYSPFTGKNGK